MNRGYAALLAALLLTAYLILTLAAVPLRARADGFTLGPGILAAMQALAAAPASDEDFLPPDYAVSRAFDTEGRVYVYTDADGVTVYDRDDRVVACLRTWPRVSSSWPCAAGWVSSSSGAVSSWALTPRR